MPHARQNMLEAVKSSVIRQKGETQIGCFKKTKYAKFACVYQGVRNVCFFGKFDVLCFLETSVLRLALLPYYRRNALHDKGSF